MIYACLGESDFSNLESSASSCESNDRKLFPITGNFKHIVDAASMQTTFEVTKISNQESKVSSFESDDRKLFKVAGKSSEVIGNFSQCDLAPTKQRGRVSRASPHVAAP